MIPTGMAAALEGCHRPIHRSGQAHHPSKLAVATDDALRLADHSKLKGVVAVGRARLPRRLVPTLDVQANAVSSVGEINGYGAIEGGVLWVLHASLWDWALAAGCPFGFGTMDGVVERAKFRSAPRGRRTGETPKPLTFKPKTSPALATSARV